MGKKGGSRHLKRLAAPAFWPIHRKEKTWVTKPRAGAHSQSQSLPLSLVIREMLGISRIAKESHSIISRGEVLVDGVKRTDEKFSVGLMDLIEIPSVKKIYRLLTTSDSTISLHEVSSEEANFKLCRIENKTTTRGGQLQLNLHDGRNVLAPENESSSTYSTSDTLRIKLPSNEIESHLKLKKGAYVLLTGGKNLGIHGLLTHITKPSKTTTRVAKLQTADQTEFNAPFNYLFVVGDGTPTISLPTEN